MVWRIEFSAAAAKQLSKLDKPVAARITAFLRGRVAALDDPRSVGEALRGEVLGRYWKYRVSEWRLICSIQDHKILITVVTVGNRRDVYQ